jgi:hypothetical protein
MNMENNKGRHRLPATFVCTALFFLLCSLKASPPPNPSVSFTFTLSSTLKTSAGVYTADSVLIKTLWSGVVYTAGTHTATWDGTTDDGLLAGNGNYYIKVISSNMSYVWDGTIGNNSDANTGNTVQRGFDPINCMAISGNYAYYAKGYSEGSPSQLKFNLATPRTRMQFLPLNGSTGQSTTFVSADTANVYWAGNDPFNNTLYFVFATRTSNDAERIFAAGGQVKTKWGTTYASAIDTITNVNAIITGMAVQKKGKYLFIAHAKMNEVHVLNKTTGALVQTLPFTAPKMLAVDTLDQVWMLYTSGGVATLGKFSVDTSGAMTALGITLSGLSDPLAMAVTPDNQTIVVTDGGSSQQLKSFSNSTGVASWTYGQAGGYANGPAVTDDKFYFSDLRDTLGSFIAFQPDGSFWVGDLGNTRAQHYAANRSFLDRVMYQPHFYSCAVDANNPTRIFADYREFQVDYSKPLARNNGSWTLVRNWGYTVPLNHDDKYYRLRGVTTLGNGRTYVLLANTTTKKFQVVELPASGNLRFSGVYVTMDNSQLYPDGSLRKVTRLILNQPTVWTKRALTGFDASNNPLWATETTVASSPAITGKDPGYWGNTNKLKSGEVTSSGVVIAFDGANGHPGFDNYHLGGIKTGTSKWLWRTAPSTIESYRGPFPADGVYDIGNNVQYSGVSAMALDRSIFWGYHGEFWKNSQTNKWNQVYDNGLFVGQFGVTGPEVAGQEAPAGMAGNGFSANLVKVGDTAFLYHNDEGHSGGVHRWRITGFNTIQEQVDTVALSTTGNGLLASYYNSIDLNNVNHTISRIDTNVHINLAGTGLADTTHFSASWTGYVQPQYSEKYIFYTNTDEGVRLWINDSLLIDHRGATVPAEYSDTIVMKAGMRYPVRMEFFQTGGSAAASLSWSSASQPKAPVPYARLFPADMPDYSGGYDLLEHLPFNKVLEHNMYGWRRDPVVEDYTDQYNKYWNVQTNMRTYRKESPDLYIKFRQKLADTSTVTRDLGTVSSSITGWQLSGKLEYGNYPNEDTLKRGPDGTGGTFVEVLDDQGKVIARFFWNLAYSTKLTRLYINNKVIVSGQQSALAPIYTTPQPISISMSGDSVLAQYGVYAPVKAPKFDTGAHLNKPKTLRFYFWTKTYNSDRIIDIESMKFSTSTGSLLMGNNGLSQAQPAADTVPLPVFQVYPNPVQGSSFYIRLLKNCGPELQVRVMALSGRTILNKRINGVTDGYYPIQLNSKPAPGLYIVTVNGRYSQKLLIY